MTRKSKEVAEFDSTQLLKRPTFNVGDSIQVDLRIVEGDKERIQSFTGVVIAKKGKGIGETFTLYRTAYGCSMERVFVLHSPFISNIEVIRSGKVRRSKLYYLKGKSGKASKVEEKMGFMEEEHVSEAPTEGSSPV